MTRYLEIARSRLNFNLFLFPLSVFLAIEIYLSVYSNNNIQWIILSGISLIPLTLKPKYLIATVVVASLAFVIHQITVNEKVVGLVSSKYKVVGKTSMGPIIDKDGTNIFIKTRKDFNKGDIIYVYGLVTDIKNTSDFDIKTYFNTLNTQQEILFPKLHLVESSNDIRNQVHEYILSGGENYNKVTPLLFLGLKTKESKEIYNLSIKMNIVHLFVISGFHISLFFAIIFKLMTKIKIKESYAMWISLIPVLVYLFMLGFPISASRAVLLTSLAVFNKTILKSKFSSLTILSFVMGFMFVIKPRSVYSLSFIFTFIATYAVIIVNSIKFNSNVRKFMAIAIFAFISNIVIVMYENHYYSVFGILYGFILSPIFVVMYALTMFLFPFKDLTEYLDAGFILIIKTLGKTNILVDIPKFSINWIFLSYGFVLTSIIILVTWNLYTEKKGSLWTKKLIGP